MILVTGFSGFLGSYIIDEIKTSNEKIITLGRNKEAIIHCDLSNEVPKIEKNENLELVIHNAGKAHSTNNDEKYFQVNVQGTLNLLKGLDQSTKPKKFIFISTVAVYGLDYGTDIKENTELFSSINYGKSKIEAEKIISDWCQKNNVVCTILRLPLVVGKNPPGNLGSMIKGIRKNYYFNIGGGKAKKSMVLANDVAKFIPIIASIGGVYNLTDGHHPSFYELSIAIGRKKALNLPKTIAKILANIGDLLGDKAPFNSDKLKKITNDLTFDDTKARKYGWEPQTVLEYLKNHNI